MKKHATKQARPRSGARGGRERPQEFERGWHELEAQHDRIKSDWASLAAQLGIAGGGPDD